MSDIDKFRWDASAAVEEIVRLRAENERLRDGLAAAVRVFGSFPQAHLTVPERRDVKIARAALKENSDD